MAAENVKKFEDMLRSDEGLQAKLQDLANAFDGELADEKAIFEATIGKLAEEAGLPFTYEEGSSFFASERELTDDELNAVAGGGGACYIIGGSSGVEAECGRAEGHACAYVGIGIIDCVT
ncbi:MAG: hypothetical protein K5859_07540 [Atopobiaceae bacterium]|nr:hypothetical protein [Atopobiaceae bacterium]